MTSSLQICRAGGAILCAILAFTTPQTAKSAPVACAERGASFRMVTPADGDMAIAFAGGDLVSWVVLSGSPKVMIDIGSGFQAANSTGSFSAPSGWNSFGIRVSGDRASVAVSCSEGAGTTSAAGTAGTVSASSQTFATTLGIGANTQARFQTGANAASGGHLFVSTSNLATNPAMAPEWNAWASYEGRGYSGGISGASFDFVGGIDRMVAPELFVGILGGYGRSFVTDTGTAKDSSSPMIGGYFGANVGQNLVLDGFLSYAQPSYQISGAQFEASRLSAGVTLTGQIERPRVVLEPFLHAHGYQENQPGYTTGGGTVIAPNATATMMGSLGLRVKLVSKDQPSKLIPYFSAATDFKRADSSLTGTDLVTAPRFGFGLSGHLGKGQVSLDIDLGKTRSDTFDQGVKLGYKFKF